MGVHKYRVYDLRKRRRTFTERLADLISNYYPLLFIIGILSLLTILAVIHSQGRPDFLLPYGSV
ncbi:MAG: hypothetical protein ACOX08_11610 [Methanobacterium sp.]|jgi:hypothetical protein